MFASWGSLEKNTFQEGKCWCTGAPVKFQYLKSCDSQFIWHAILVISPFFPSYYTRLLPTISSEIYIYIYIKPSIIPQLFLGLCWLYYHQKIGQKRLGKSWPTSQEVLSLVANSANTGPQGPLFGSRCPNLSEIGCSTGEDLAWGGQDPPWFSRYFAPKKWKERSRQCFVKSWQELETKQKNKVNASDSYGHMVNTWL